MVIAPFKFARIPVLIFGNGTIAQLPEHLIKMGKHVLLVTGKKSFRTTEEWNRLVNTLKEHGAMWYEVHVADEPSPDLIDETVVEFREQGIEVVAAIGGGSVIDAGKAISAMLREKGSVLDYLEGVGSGAVHSGNKVPFIAVPTTAGTGSEATKNAVLSRIGREGFKNSLRHDNFVPDVALVDPQLTLTCPPALSAACGMDAFTQLLESYVSTKANPMTDALAFSGMAFCKENLIKVCTKEPNNPESRTAMSYAAFISGITLANAGLGIVHGLAGPMGGFFRIPHGVACGTLLSAAVKSTIRKLQETDPGNSALEKYARVGALLRDTDEKDMERSLNTLIDTLEEWTSSLHLPRLGAYSITPSDFDKIIKASSNKNNPISLNDDEVRTILSARL